MIPRSLVQRFAPFPLHLALAVLVAAAGSAALGQAQSPGQSPGQSPAQTPGQTPTQASAPAAAAQTAPAPSAPAAGPAPAAPAPAPAASSEPIGPPRVVEDVVARVNDQIITESDYHRAEQQLEAEGRQQNASQAEIEQQKKDLLRDLIDQQLLLSKGKELGITGESELVRRLDDIRKQNHLDSLEDLEKAAQQQGVSYEDFKANVRNGIIRQEVVREEVVKRMPRMTEADAERYYKEHESEFAKPETVKLGEILIPTPAPAASGAVDEAQLAAAKAKADEMEARLKAGANFQELARSASSGPTAAQGGDLGEFRRGVLAKELEDKTFSLDTGQYTEPLRTKQGYIILKVLEHTRSGDAGFKAAEPQVEDAMFQQAMQPAMRSYLTKQREEAYVEVKPGFVDSGASPNETRPVYSAYVPPAPKKKRVVSRVRYRQRGRSAASRRQTEGGNGAAAPAGSNLPPAGAPAAETATPAAPAAPAAKQTASQVAAANKVQKPGKREKIRFGQAPRQSLPNSSKDEATQTAVNEAPAPPLAGTPSAANAAAAGSDAAGAAAEANGAAGTGAPANADGSVPTTAPSSSAVNSTIRYADGTVVRQGRDATAPDKKTRFSDRARLPKDKHAKQKAKAAAAAEAAANAPTPDEVAAQKVQSAPLGLAGDTSKPVKKPKRKGEKVRYADQPHAAPAQPAPNLPSNTVPAPAQPGPGPASSGPGASGPGASGPGSTQP